MILQNIPTDLLDSETMQILAQNKSALGSLMFALNLFGVIIGLLVVALMVIIIRFMKKISSMSETVIENKIKRGVLEKTVEKFATKMDDFVVAMNKQPELIRTVQTHDTKIAKLEENQSNFQSKYPI